MIHLTTLLLRTLTGTEVADSSRWVGARITSEVSAATLIGPLWINVTEASSCPLITHPEALQAHRLNPTGSGSRCVQFSTGGFQDEVLVVLPRPPWRLGSAPCGNC